MACRRLGQMVLGGNRLWPGITTSRKAMQIPRRLQGSLSFDTFKARLDQKLEESRMKPTAEADLDLELAADNLDAQERESELNEDLERVKDMARKLIDLMPRYGHEMTTKRMSRFRALATYQPTLGNRWIKVILKRPELLDEVASQDLMAFVDFCLLDLRLTKTSSFDLVCSLPIVLFDQPSIYKDLLLNWVALCEKNGLNVRLVIDNPNILAMTPMDWAERIEDLSEFFNIKKDLAILATNNPTIFTETGAMLKEKLDYLVMTMIVKPQDIAHSNILQMDLKDIKKRFLFLDRCGLYTFPNVKDAGKSTSSEPHIKELSTSSDEEFLANVTKGQLTIEEFDAFVDQLLPEELATEVDEHELRMQREAEELANEGGYYDPSIEEDISQTYRDKHNWQGMPEKFNEK